MKPKFVVSGVIARAIRINGQNIDGFDQFVLEEFFLPKVIPSLMPADTIKSSRASFADLFQI